MSRPDLEESRSDLKRLYEIVEYYKRIGGQYDTSKSEKLASSFVKIAEEAVQKAGKTPPKLKEADGDINADIQSLIPPADYIHGSTNIAFSTSASPAAPYLSTMDETEERDISFLQYLNWPQHPGLEWEGLAMGDCASMSNQPSQTADGNQYPFDPAMMDDFMKWTGDQAKQNPLDMSFDWFSLDNQ